MQLENARKVRGIPPKKVILAEDFVKFNKNRNPTIPRSSMDTKIQKQEERYRKAKPSSNGLTPVKRSALWPRQWTQQQVILVSTPPPFSEPVSWRPLRDTSFKCPASSPQSFLSQLIGASLLCVPEAPGPTPDSTSPRVLGPGFLGPFRLLHADKPKPSLCSPSPRDGSCFLSWRPLWYLSVLFFLFHQFCLLNAVLKNREGWLHLVR